MLGAARFCQEQRKKSSSLIMKYKYSDYLEKKLHNFVYYNYNQVNQTNFYIYIYIYISKYFNSSSLPFLWDNKDHMIANIYIIIW